MPGSRLILDASPLLFCCFRTLSSPVFSVLCGLALSGLINHLEKVEEGRVLEDDEMQTTMNSQRIRQLDTNRAETTPDRLRNPSYELLLFYFSASRCCRTAAVLVFTSAELNWCRRPALMLDAKGASIISVSLIFYPEQRVNKKLEDQSE